MRPARDFRPGRMYGVTQRGNRGQWVHADRDDFLEAIWLMRKYTVVYGVRIHAFTLMHNHSHWIFESSSEESISNLMRDMQGNYSRYLNRKYKFMPWLLLAPHLRSRGRRRGRRNYSPFLRTGPVNWSPRFHAVELDAAGYRTFMKYVETNPVRAKLVKRAERWEWSSAAAHCGADRLPGGDFRGLLCLEAWQHVFGRPATVATDWQAYLAGDADTDSEAVAVVPMPAGREGPYNRPVRWVAPTGGRVAGGESG